MVQSAVSQSPCSCEAVLINICSRDQYAAIAPLGGLNAAAQIQGQAQQADEVEKAQQLANSNTVESQRRNSFAAVPPQD